MKRTIPYDLAAERAVLGAALAGEAPLSVVLSELREEDFYSEVHRRVFRAIRAAAKDGRRDIDHVLVGEYLPPGSDARRLVLELVEAVPVGANAKQHCEVVRTASRARAAQLVAEKLQHRIEQGEWSEAAETALGEMEEALRESENADARTFEDGALDELAAWLDEARESRGVAGIRTGIPKLDLAVGGLRAGRYYVVAGRPGSGKSTLVGQMALAAARQGKRVLIQSAEMAASDYLKRMATAAANVDAARVEEGRFSEEEKRRILKAAVEIAQLPLFVDDSGSQTPSHIRRNVIRRSPDLLVVDYLQRLMPESHLRKASRYEQVSHISYEIDRLKKDFGLAVVAAAQLNRSLEQRHDKRPVLSDLRESGAIEQDADAVIMLHRPGFYDDSEPEETVELHVEKNRFGPLAETHLTLTPSMWIASGAGEEAIASA